MNFYLIGFMGSGKSHWGKAWATHYKTGFIDLDAAIEMEVGATIEEIFESKGEDYFREIESKALRNCVNYNNTIISCGGGTACYYNNIDWMNEHGITVYLTASPDEILRRLLKGEQDRPLLKKINQAELLFFIQKKLAEREAFYSKANIILDSSTITDQTFEEKILIY